MHSVWNSRHALVLCLSALFHPLSSGDGIDSSISHPGTTRPKVAPHSRGSGLFYNFQNVVDSRKTGNQKTQGCSTLKKQWLVLHFSKSGRRPEADNNCSSFRLLLGIFFFTIDLGCGANFKLGNPNLLRVRLEFEIGAGL